MRPRVRRKTSLSFIQLTLGLCILGGTTWFVLHPASLVTNPNDAAFVTSVFREISKGHLNGVFPHNPCRATVRDLRPADIIFCHNPDGSYGYWTHVALYVGDGRVLDSCDFVKGTELKPVEGYSKYAGMMVLRPQMTDTTRDRILQTALQQLGKPYDPFSTISDTRTEYCSKLIWQVFRQNGIALCPKRAWIVPDDLSRSTALVKVAQVYN